MRILPCLAVAVPLLCLLLAGLAEAKGVALVKAGRPCAAIVIDSRCYPLQQDVTNIWATVERTIQNIAGVVAEYVAKSTGATLPVVDLATAKPPANTNLLYIGRGETVDKLLGPALAKLDQSGYFIRALDDRRLVIVGPTSEGTEFGTFEFLERCVGVRWLMPTEVGDYVPKRPDLIVPAGTAIKDEPAFMQVPGIASMPTHQTWARRMRFWTRLNFHHNLVNLFPPEVYTKSHPEFFPLLRPGDTQRHLPVGHSEDFQPCFTAPGIVDEAAKNIIAALNANPRVKSYSFGCNDSNTYCHCPNCEQEYIAGQTFCGMTQYSDAYFKFVNAVIEKVLKVHPDAWFGCLAYSHVALPPVNVPVHPRMVPFMTMDTMQFLDPQRRAAHEALLKAWSDKCTLLGRYDYTYGDHHVPPRIYLHHWADYVRWARAHKVKAWYAETYPFFGEAPKYYVMAKIWWNPDRNVDALLDEWYRLSFGKAAPPMKAYFAHWEDYWTRRIPRTDFFKRCVNEQYLMGNPGWLEAATADDIAQADAWLAAAQKLADTPETKARVDVMARSWAYYRIVIETYVARGEARERLGVEQAVALLSGDAAHLAQPLHALYQSLMADPILVFTWNSSYPYGTAERAPFLDAAEAYFDTKDPRLAEKLRALAAGGTATAALAATVLAVADGTAANLTPNAGFEAAQPLDGWWAGAHLGSGQITATQTQPFEGANAVQVVGTYDGYGGVFRTDVPVKPGKRYLFVLRSRWEGQPSIGTVCQMLVQFHDRAGRVLSNSLSGHQFKSDEQWRAFSLVSREAPAEAAFATVRVDAMTQPQTGHTTFFDALALYEVDGGRQ